MKKFRLISVLRNRWMAAAVVVLAATAVFINWYYYREIRANLDREFGIRLRSIASLVAENISGSYSIDYSEIDSPRLIVSGEVLEKLRDIAGEYSLANIMVIREDGMVLFSTENGLTPPGEDYLNWGMDYRAIVTALEGKAASTELIRSQYGSYMKAGYSPLDGEGKSAELVAAVEASPSFLSSMGEWRRSLIAASLLLAGGILLAVILILKSADSLLRARESLMRAETLASMGRMAAVITHEIRNPLFIIRSSAEKLRETHPESAGEIDEYIIDETDRLDRTLTDYLSFSRGEKTERRRTDLSKILSRSVKSIAETADSAELEIDADLRMGAAPFYGDEKRLLQGFMNILINSVQALDGRGRIAASIRTVPGYYRIDISDDGPGIPENSRPKVFEPFYTTKSTGTGIGLYAASQTATDHGGSIELQSEEGSGTTVSVYLPIENLAEPGEDNE